MDAAWIQFGPAVGADAFRHHLRVTNLAADRRCPRHRRQREQRQDEHDAGVEAGGASHAAPSPQAQPRCEPGEQHQRERDQRAIVMLLDGLDRDIRHLLELHARGDATEIRRKRDERDDVEHLEAHARQRFLTAEQPEEQQAKRDGAADGRDVIQDEMKMWSVHGSPLAPETRHRTDVGHQPAGRRRRDPEHQRRERQHLRLAAHRMSIHVGVGEDPLLQQL